MLQAKKLERRSIRGLITKAINKLKKEIDAGNNFAVAVTKASLQRTLEDSEKKDIEIWAVYDDDATLCRISTKSEHRVNFGGSKIDFEKYASTPI